MIRMNKKNHHILCGAANIMRATQCETRRIAGASKVKQTWLLRGSV